MPRMPHALAVIVVLFMLHVAPSVAGGQVTTGNLDGKVTDETGAVVPGVSVTISSPALMGTRSATTSDTGIYRFPALPPGVYSVTFELDGFEQLVRAGIRVELAATATLDAQLRLSTLQETVTVTGAAPTVDVRSTASATRFDSQLLEELPSSRQLIGLLAQTPGVQSATIEVGASNLAAYSAPRVYGIAGRQQFNLDGVDITQGVAHVGTYPDYISWAEVSVLAGGHTAEAKYPGVLTETVIKSGSNAFSGDVYFDYQNPKFESDNSSPELAARGLRRGDRLENYWEGAGSLAGPIKRDRVWFYTSLRRQRYTQFPGGYFEFGTDHPRSAYTQLDGFTLKGTYKLSLNNTLTSFVQRTTKHVPQNGASATNTPEATTDWYVYGTPWKVQWTSVLNDRMFVDAGLYYHLQDWNTYANAREPRRNDLTTTWRAGQNLAGATSDTSNYRREAWRPQARARFQTNFEQHEVKIGFEYVPYYENNTFKGSFGEMTHIYRNGTTPVGVPLTTPELQAGRFGRADQVILNNTPVTQKAGVLTYGGFVQDTWTMFGRVTLNLGARVDHMEAFFPEQSSPARLWASEESFPEIRNLINWTSFAPRIGVVYALTADKRTALKFSYGRYFEVLEPRPFNIANPNGMRSAYYTWNDRNGSRFLANPDGTIDLNEINLSQPFRLEGGSQDKIDPDLQQPKVHEFSLAIDQELFTGFALHFDYNYRRFVDNMGLVGEFQPFDQYNLPVPVIDPGPDGRVGTGDDATFTGYNLNPALLGAANLGNVLTSPEDFDQFYHTFSISGDRRLRDNWQLRGSFTVGTIDEVLRGATSFDNRFTYLNWPANPNEAANSRTDWLYWNGRVMGSYMWPGPGLQFSGVLKMQSGEQFARRFTTRAGELNYGLQVIWAEPLNTNRLDNTYMLDLRVDKRFRLGNARDFSLILDCFNVGNTAAIRGVTSASGPSYLRVNSIVNPRVFKLGARLRF